MENTQDIVRASIAKNERKLHGLPETATDQEVMTAVRASIAKNEITWVSTD